MIDLALLRILKYKEQFDKVERFIPLSAIDKKTKAIVADIGKYFEANPDEKMLDFPSFRSSFFTVWHKGLKDEDCDFYNALLTKMEDDVPDSVRKNIINQLLELEFVTDLANVVTEYQQGEEVDAVMEVKALLAKVDSQMERQSSFEYDSFLCDKFADKDMSDAGMEWPLPIMNEIYRNILGGDQYIVAARPGKGKTSFLTFLNWSMAQQMPKGKVILWFNNESVRQRIISRQIQSALNATNKELFELKQSGKLKDAYDKAMNGVEVRVYDIHGKNTSFIEDIIDSVGRNNVGAIVIDMLDNVKFSTRSELREDQRLEQMYQWSRELGVSCDCPVFPTSQISNEGVGLLFPTENMLKDSKTGKQGACDGIIMIGASDDPLKQTIRGLSMPKTKSKREGQFDMREEVHFDADRGRFKC